MWSQPQTMTPPPNTHTHTHWLLHPTSHQSRSLHLLQAQDPNPCIAKHQRPVQNIVLLGSVLTDGCYFCLVPFSGCFQRLTTFPSGATTNNHMTAFTNKNAKSTTLIITTAKPMLDPCTATNTRMNPHVQAAKHVDREQSFAWKTKQDLCLSNQSQQKCLSTIDKVK